MHARQSCCLLYAIQVKYTTVKESLDFSEAERAALVETNAEIEHQSKALAAQLQDRTLSLEQAKLVTTLGGWYSTLHLVGPS